MKEITKKAKPNTKVILLSNNSEPLSFWLENNSVFPPEIIWLASLALLLCNNTNAINNTDIINNAVYIYNNLTCYNLT